MQREFKFRVWIPKLGMMVEPYSVTGHGTVWVNAEEFEDSLPAHLEFDGEDVKVRLSGDGMTGGEHVMQMLTGEESIFLDPDDFVLMQFTGLQDCGLADIYEGDLIRLPELYETPEMTSKQYMVMQVVFLHGAFTLSAPDYDPTVDDHTLAQEMESYDGDMLVVGNIYQGQLSTCI